MDNPLCDVAQTKSGPRQVFSSKESRTAASWPSFAIGISRRPNSRRAIAFFRSLTKCSGVKINHYDPKDIEAFRDPIEESRISTRSVISRSRFAGTEERAPPEIAEISAIPRFQTEPHALRATAFNSKLEKDGGYQAGASQSQFVCPSEI